MKLPTIARIAGTTVLACAALAAALGTASMQAPQHADQVAAVVAPAVPTTYTPVHSTTRNEAQCRAAAYVIYHTGAYSGTDTEVACFGAEDDPRVGLALDYGMTEAQYAETEAAQGGSYTNPHS